MISERDLAEKFTNIWKEHFPLLTASYMKIFNEARPKAINSEIYIDDTVEIRYDLVSQLAFNIAEKITLGQVTDKEAWNIEFLKPIINQTSIEIWNKEKINQNDIILSEFEKKDCQKICNNILEFISLTKVNTYSFKPKFSGYGLISDLTGDIEIDDTLYEIKTVKRNFRSSDIKQLIIYLALSHIKDNNRWKYAGLYNPRKGTYCKINIEKLIYDISAGKSTTESFKSLLDSFTREVNIDSRF